ncbi:hypothetical protein COOONC_23502 [Cooperia oncophora]
MTLCGADLTHLYQAVGSSLTDGTILRVAIRTLLALKQLHEIGFVHRDVKPCNFAVSSASPRIIHVIDFGSLSWYIAVLFSGCTSSIRAGPCGSWAYMFIEMRDSLPWAKVNHPEAVLGLKEETPLEKLCCSDLSKVFLPIIKSFVKLGYFDRPDYKMIFETLMEEVKKLKVNLTDPYDWDGKVATDPEVSEKLAEGMSDFFFFLSSAKAKYMASDYEQLAIIASHTRRLGKACPWTCPRRLRACGAG